MCHRRTVALGVLFVFLASGCALRDRKWGTCAVAGGIIGATVGGVPGGVAVNNTKTHPRNEERGAAIGGGIVGGGLIGALLGHAVCDPEKEAPPPPPPPAPAPPPPPPAKAEPLVTLHGPQFDFNKATLKPAGKKMVDEAVTVMKDKPSMKVSVEGHTDSIGSDAYNQKLSERRAQAVRDYMVSQGIDAARISVKGWGKTKPIASNKTEAGRAENRRGEIIPEGSRPPRAWPAPAAPADARACPASSPRLGVCPGNHGERGERAGERERQAQRRPTRCGARNARRVLVAAGGRSEQPSGSAAAAALPRIVRRSHHDYPDGLLGSAPPPGRRAPLQDRGSCAPASSRARTDRLRPAHSPCGADGRGDPPAAADATAPSAAVGASVDSLPGWGGAARARARGSRRRTRGV